MNSDLLGLHPDEFDLHGRQKPAVAASAPTTLNTPAHTTIEKE